MAETGVQKTKVPAPESILDDEKSVQEGNFVGATLQINAAAKNGDDPGVKFAGPTFNRETRPGSVYGRQSIRSTSSRTSLKPGVVKCDREIDTFFSYQGSSFETAVADCKKLTKEDIDGPLQGAYLLSEVDHWDCEHEKVMLLMEDSLMIFKYNFITKKIQEYKRIMHHILDTILLGDFKYPQYSVMPERKHGGIQLKWNKGQDPTFGQKWNPWCTDIPWATFCHHPLIYSPKESETVTYSVDDFYESLVQAVSKNWKKKRPGEKITTIEGPIMMDSYASLGSLIFNQSGLGFFRDRNGICY